MNQIELITMFFAGGLILATFLMVGKLRLMQMLRYFAIASFFLAALGASVAIFRGDHEPFIGPIATVLFKVIFIPAIIYFTSKRVPSSNHLKMYVRPATTYFLFALILIISGVIIRNLPIDFGNAITTSTIIFSKILVFISVALVLTGLLLTIIRKDLFSQVLGLLTMENGIATFGLVALGGMPLFLEMGIFFVIIVSTVILAYLTQKVHEEYSAGDTTSLNELFD